MSTGVSFFIRYLKMKLPLKKSIFVASIAFFSALGPIALLIHLLDHELEEGFKIYASIVTSALMAILTMLVVLVSENGEQ